MKIKTINLLKPLLLIFCFGLLLTSCSKRNDDTLELKQDENFVSATKAAAIAINNVKKSNGASVNAIGAPIAKKIASNIEVKSSDDLTAFYIVNYEGSGFAVVSADRRTPSVLAYSPKGKLTPEGDNPGVQLWFKSIKKEIQELRKKNIPYKNQDKGNVIPFIDKNNSTKLGGKTYLNPPGDPEPCEDYTIGAGPFLNTSWGYGYGYNQSMPTAPSGCGYNYKYYTGCNAIAMSQLMYFYGYPSTSYNFSIMPTAVDGSNIYTSGATEISYLMRDAAADVSPIYTCNETLGYPSSIPGSLSGTFDFVRGGDWYSGSSLVYQTVGSLLYGRPVILTASDSSTSLAHTWLCDGSVQFFTYLPGNPECSANGSFVYLHMNWGWYGTQDGWYIETDFSNANGNYMTGLFALTYIHPTSYY